MEKRGCRFLQKVFLHLVFLRVLSAEFVDFDKDTGLLQEQREALESKKTFTDKKKDKNMSIAHETDKEMLLNRKKSGVFLGAEVMLGNVSADISFLYRTNLGTTIPVNMAKTFLSFATGGILGYQYFFGETARHGIKISSHFGTGTGFTNEKIKVESLRHPDLMLLQYL